MLTYEDFKDIVIDITLPTAYELRLKAEPGMPDSYYLQVRCWRKDVITGAWDWGYGGKGRLSKHMAKSEVVSLAFGLYKGYVEHEARETFKYKGRRVYGPHISVDALWEAAMQVDVRATMPKRADVQGLQPSEGHGVTL